MEQHISENKTLFKTHKSYSPEEILAAGGTTAFGRKREKDIEAAAQALRDAPPIEPFSDEEWTKLMEDIARDK